MFSASRFRFVLVSPMDLLRTYHVVEHLVLAALTARVLSGLLYQPRLRSSVPSTDPGQGRSPLLSILIPARNEAANIGRCVQSLLAQDHPSLEIIVLDDQSTDDTADIVRRLQEKDRRITLLSGQDLPSGWVGKNWACHQLSLAAKGEWLLFTDADTWHEPSHARRLLAAATHHRADLISSWPEQIMESWSEKAVVSLLPFVGTVGYPHALIRALHRLPLALKSRIPRSVARLLGAANGQVLMMSRSAYDRIGGHEHVHNHLVEDIALGRAVAERMGEGMWWVNVDGRPFVRCRMYRDFKGVWEGFSKNIRAAFENHALAFLLSGVAQIAFLLIPFGLVAWSLCLGRLEPMAVRECLWILALRTVVAAFAGGSWLSAIAHPLSWSLALLIGINSGLRSTFGQVTWKGRRYVHDPEAGTKKTPR